MKRSEKGTGELQTKGLPRVSTFCFTEIQIRTPSVNSPVSFFLRVLLPDQVAREIHVTVRRNLGLRVERVQPRSRELVP